MPGARVKVRFAGQDVDGFVLARAAHDRPHRHAHAAATGGQRRAGAPPGDRRARRAARRALRRHPVRRAPAGRPAAARDDREASRRRRRSRPRSTSRPLARRGPRYPAGRRVPGPPGRRRHATRGLVGAAGRGLAAPARARGRGDAVGRPGQRARACPTGATSPPRRGARPALLGAGHHVVLTADAGPGAPLPRVPGRRPRHAPQSSSAPARPRSRPVHDLGLVAIWDDGDDLHAEPRAPYPHAREVLLTRAQVEQAAALVGGFARSVEAEHLLAHRLGARARRAARGAARRGHGRGRRGQRARPRPRPAGARPRGCPRRSTSTVPRGWQHGPVLVQTPRPGYAAALACERCRTPARCAACSGPARAGRARRAAGLRLVRHRRRPRWACPSAADRGSGRPCSATPAPPRSWAGPSPARGPHAPAATACSPTVDDEPAIVVATPGAEPVAAGGYAAVVLLDTWLALARPDLRTEEEALRRWLDAAGLVPPGGHVAGGRRPGPPGAAGAGAVGPVRLRTPRGGRAARRRTCHRPAGSPPSPASPGRSTTRSRCSTRPPGTEVLGPVEIDEGESRVVVRVPRAQAAALSRALGEVQRRALGAQARRRPHPGRPADAVRRPRATLRWVSGS